MFKSNRWRGEKNKIKAVFKLQFHVTQLGQVVGDGLMVSIIPADVGKPTARLEKTKIWNGSCYWEKPVIETVKFVQEPKTGKIHEKIYHFVVANGTSKFGIVGEASVDLASYAESTKISSLSLPLKNTKSQAILHVSIQRTAESFDQREAAEIEKTSFRSQDKSLRAQLSNGDIDVSIKDTPHDGSLNDSNSPVVEVKRNRQASSGSDITLSSSGSSSGLDILREPDLQSNSIHENNAKMLTPLRHGSLVRTPALDSSRTISEEHQGSQWEWLEGSAPELSTDDSSVSPRETLLRQMSEDGPPLDFETSQLKNELTVLARQAEVSELELQTLRKQIVKESKRGQDLSRELVTLKEERESYKEELEKLKNFKKEAKVTNKLLADEGDCWALIEELRDELNHEKNLNSNLRLQLQKTQESNSELILAVRDLDEMLEKKNMETPQVCQYETNNDEEQKALEELVNDHIEKNDTNLLELKIRELSSEIELCRKEKDEVEMQMEQLALDYEILKQENHEIAYKLEQSEVQEQLKLQYECSTSYATLNELQAEIENLESELKIRSKESSESMAAAKELEIHAKSLEQELENQASRFEADLDIIMRAKVEQEQRAIQAEEALRKTRLQNANTAERLQEEFRRLSIQMASTFDANEKVAMKALDEANGLRLGKRHLEGMLEKGKEDLQSLKDYYETKLLGLSNQMTVQAKEMEAMQKQITDLSRELEQQKEENETLVDNAEKMKASIMESEMLLERGIMERKELDITVALTKKELESSVNELVVMKAVIVEKEAVIANLQCELEVLKNQCADLRHNLAEDEQEKEKLSKQVLQLKGDLKKKEDALSCLEKKHKDTSRSALEGSKMTPKNSKPAIVARSPKEITNLKEKIKLLEGQIKLKETALESSENSFAEKEKDLQHRIEELEKRLNELQKEARDAEDLTLNGRFSENMSSAECSSPVRETESIISPDGELNVSPTVGDNGKDNDHLSNEIAILMDKNKSMEGELKEMQERYSEISLKFAEVEGERQQLVMKLRNLKNAKKFW